MSWVQKLNSLIILPLLPIELLISVPNKRKPSRAKRTPSKTRRGAAKTTPRATQGRESAPQIRQKKAKEVLKKTSKPKEIVDTKQNATAYFVEIDENREGQRLDNFLITHLKGVPKTHIYRIIRKGEVRVNKGRAKQTTRLELGDRVRIPPIKQVNDRIKNVDASHYDFLNDATLYEDDSILVLNKPSGMAVHAGSGIKVGVIEALRVLRSDIKYLELVHRLDRETSGCLVLAKKASVLKQLHQDFKNNSTANGRLDKRYLALVKGNWKYGERSIIKSLNTAARRHGERYVVVDENGSFAKSIARPISSSEVASLIEVKLLTGRTHQVRVHTQSENHPIASDTKYGDTEFNKKMKGFGLKRLFLHASSIKLIHPSTEKPIRFEAPLPGDLQNVLSKLNITST